MSESTSRAGCEYHLPRPASLGFYQALHILHALNPSFYAPPGSSGGSPSSCAPDLDPDIIF